MPAEMRCGARGSKFGQIGSQLPTGCEGKAKANWPTVWSASWLACQLYRRIGSAWPSIGKIRREIECWSAFMSVASHSVVWLHSAEKAELLGYSARHSQVGAVLPGVCKPSSCMYRLLSVSVCRTRLDY